MDPWRTSSTGRRTLGSTAASVLSRRCSNALPCRSALKGEPLARSSPASKTDATILSWHTPHLRFFRPLVFEHRRYTARHTRGDDAAHQPRAISFLTLSRARITVFVVGSLQIPAMLVGTAAEGISIADLIAYGGAYATRITGGPTIKVSFGRMDATSADPEVRAAYCTTALHIPTACPHPTFCIQTAQTSASPLLRAHDMACRVHPARPPRRFAGPW